MTIINWLNQVLVEKKDWDSFSESEQKTFSPYMINRFLSMDKDFIEIVNYFQKYSIGLLHNKDIYNFYRHLLPKGKRFNRYIKNKNSKKYKDWLVDLLCKHFEISKIDSIEYLSLLNKENLKQILDLYGIEKKKLKEIGIKYE
tara:strand:- start:1362 stop:1790 length:429 start_codon:yes stop_codon:yes gene_type:complete